MNVRRLHVRTARSTNLVAVTVVPAQELLTRLRDSLEHYRHSLRIISGKRCSAIGAFRRNLDTHLVHGRHVVTELFHDRVRMRTHLFGNNAPESIRTVHLQMNIISLVRAQIGIFILGRMVENKLCRIGVSHRNHEIRNHFAHVDERHIQGIRQAQVQRRIATITIVDLRRGIVIQAANRAHDNRIRTLGTDFLHQLRHIGPEEILVTVAHVVDTKLDDHIVASLHPIGNAVASRSATMLPEHIVVTDSGISLLIETTAT